MHSNTRMELFLFIIILRMGNVSPPSRTEVALHCIVNQAQVLSTTVCMHELRESVIAQCTVCELGLQVASCRYRHRYIVNFVNTLTQSIYVCMYT